jgi:ASC-1-like (ASCH) protein
LVKGQELTAIGIKLETHVAMIRDFQIFEDFMSSESFRNLSPKEQEEFVSSYNNLLEEEMDVVLHETKQLLQQKSISELFWRIYGHMDELSLREKDDQWFQTFGFRPLQSIHH